MQLFHILWMYYSTKRDLSMLFPTV